MRDRSLALNSYRQQVSRADGWETETRTQESWNLNPPYDANASVINSVTSRPTVLIDHLLALVPERHVSLGEHFSARKSALACYLYVVRLEEAIEHQQQYVDI